MGGLCYFQIALGAKRGEMSLCGKPIPKAVNGTARGFCTHALNHRGQHGSGTCSCCGIVFTKRNCSPSVFKKGSGFCRVCDTKVSDNWRRNNPEKEQAREARRRKCHPKETKVRIVRWRKNNPEKVKAGLKRWRTNNPEKYAAAFATSQLKKFLRLLDLLEDSNPRQVVSNPKISNKRLEKLTRGNGWPDWKEEALEEKKLGDGLQVTQWARAILEYRVGRKYRVAWRLTSIKRKVFKDVFAFYEWQLKQIQRQETSE